MGFLGFQILIGCNYIFTKYTLLVELSYTSEILELMFVNIYCRYKLSAWIRDGAAAKTKFLENF